MTDQTPTIPAGLTPEEAKKAREWALHALNKPGASNTAEKAVARMVIDTVPEPPPTLADMTVKERAACRWMQCGYAGETSDAQSPGVIGYFDHGDKKAVILTTKCGIVRRDYDRVTPRPDLPRLEWPGDKKAHPAPAPALPDGWRLADHEVYGRVVVTAQTPNSAGNVYFVFPDAANEKGYYWHLCAPAKLTYIDQGGDTSDTVPESTLAVGSVWHDVDALTRACEESGRDQIIVADKRGDVSVWDGHRDDWRVSVPHAEFAPFTIIRAGKKADQ